MHITIEIHGEQFNVNLHSKEGAENFLSIKGCRIVNGSKGDFVSWPATKNQNTGKYWNHCWASEKFAEAVLREAQRAYAGQKPQRQERQQRQAPQQRPSAGFEDLDDSIPF